MSSGHKETVQTAVLDRKIAAIQNSTRTSIPLMVPTHEWLRQRSFGYYQWHLNPYSNTIHWTALGVTILGMVVGVILSYYVY